MAEFLHPGIFVEETPAGIRSIPGVPTGVAGFVRERRTGSTLPGSFESLAAFERDNPQWDAARSFFEEGGKRLLVAHAATADGAGVAAALAGLSEANIVAAPGLTGPGVAAALIAHAEINRSLALIDPPPGLDVSGVQDFRAGLDSTHAALYWPWIVDRDGLQPPSPAVAAIVARADEHAGFRKRSGDEQIKTAAALEHAVANVEQDALNPLGINCLRSFPGRGHRVWGQRTLLSDDATKYVDIRRRLNWLERSIDAGLDWTAFEPSGEALWASVRAVVGSFLHAHWRDGGLLGAQPEQAYFVRCDNTTMTRTDVVAGRLTVLIGVAPLRPAQFVNVRIVKRTADGLS